MVVKESNANRQVGHCIIETQVYFTDIIVIGRRGIRPLKIVTGAGKHSAYGEAKLMPSALKLLKQEGWRYELPHPGCILVKGVNK